MDCSNYLITLEIHKNAEVVIHFWLQILLKRQKSQNVVPMVLESIVAGILMLITKSIGINNAV
jgi:hypothetical protein